MSVTVETSPVPARAVVGTAGTRTWTDQLGRTVHVRAAPSRIVSLAPAITESLFAMGAGDAVVGVTRFCNFPAEAKSRSVVGGFADPDVEKVVKLAPDLVVATADTVTRDRFDALERLGVPIFTVNPRDLAGVEAMFRALGTVTGHTGKGEALAKSLEETVAEVDRKTSARDRVRVLFLFSIDPPIAAGPSTFVDELLRHAGAVNVAANAPTSYPRFGAEGILASHPSRILTTVPGAAASLRTMLAGSPLAKGDAITEIDADLLERPGPRLGEGLVVVAKTLHPEAFAP